jgi:hypothetical protein
MSIALEHQVDFLKSRVRALEERLAAIEAREVHRIATERQAQTDHTLKLKRG